MENFFYGNEYYTDLGHLMDSLNIDEDCSNISDDWQIECRESVLEPMFTLSANWILERVDEERFSENGSEQKKLSDALMEIPYEAVNQLIPKMYYETRKKFIIRKKHLIEWCK
jgi:hypothetical protein